jgi:hypothetical protein
VKNVKPITILELAQLAKRAGEIFESQKIRYQLTGGVVASYYGEQRSTQDVDIVIDMQGIEPKSRDMLFRVLSQSFMVSRTAFDEAFANKSMFQILDLETMLRADIYVGGILPGRFERTTISEIAPGYFLPTVCVEDAILSKLVWINMGSGRSKQDVVRILQNKPEMDTQYLETTAEELGVKHILDELKTLAESNDPNIIF